MGCSPKICTQMKEVAVFSNTVISQIISRVNLGWSSSFSCLLYSNPSTPQDKNRILSQSHFRCLLALDDSHNLIQTPKPTKPFSTGIALSCCPANISTLAIVLTPDHARPRLIFPWETVIPPGLHFNDFFHFVFLSQVYPEREV